MTDNLPRSVSIPEVEASQSEASTGALSHRADQLQLELAETRAEYLAGIHRISAGAVLLLIASLITGQLLGLDLVHPYLAWPGALMAAAFFWMTRLARKQQT